MSDFEGAPEYQTDEGALDLWKYFTQKKKYFNPDKITAFDKDGIQRQIKDFMDATPRGETKGDLSQFSQKFSQKIVKNIKIIEEIRLTKFTISKPVSKVTGKQLSGSLFSIKSEFKGVTRIPKFIESFDKLKRPHLRNIGTGRFISKKAIFK